VPHSRSPLLRRLRAETSGSASLEFLGVGVLLLVPVVYLVLTLAALQAGALAAEGAARQAARSYVLAATPEEAAARADRAVELTLADYGVDPSAAEVSVACAPDPATCLSRRALVTVTVGIRVPLPLAPAALDVGTPLSVGMTGVSTQQVSRFWSGG
jgi:Flp pilus assembly protein TadG